MSMGRWRRSKAVLLGSAMIALFGCQTAPKTQTYLDDRSELRPYLVIREGETPVDGKAPSAGPVRPAPSEGR